MRHYITPQRTFKSAKEIVQNCRGDKKSRPDNILNPISCKLKYLNQRQTIDNEPIVGMTSSLISSV
jgi:hypothetical protein